MVQKYVFAGMQASRDIVNVLNGIFPILAPVPPKELHLAINDTVLMNMNSCGQEADASYENTDDEDCAEQTEWIEVGDPVRVTCNSEPSLPAAQLEWLVNGELLQPANPQEVTSPFTPSSPMSEGENCQCGHLCGGQEEASVTTGQWNRSATFRLRTYVVKICGVENHAEKL
ncbi:unnamed protein product [Schistocephalus solidus]|uniref:Ig-like domain-containing protein n=1 Tax=Schistocephalus solidus TaxID=70667 RepID=A0A183TQN4_SCHSO|nr:unnamed protein product [Schistocephalus solidus]